MVTAPAEFAVDEIFGFHELGRVPGWTTSQQGGQSRLEIQVGPTPVEWFAGLDRIVFLNEFGEGRLCYFDILAPNVIKQSMFSWIDQRPEVERDLGSLPRGGTILLEGSRAAGANTTNDTQPLGNAGDTAPTRVTLTNAEYGNTTFVFEADEVGDHVASFHVILGGYTDHISHVRWRVTP